MTGDSNGIIYGSDGAILARDLSIVGGNRLERQVVYAVRARADPVIDTSILNAAEPS